MGKRFSIIFVVLFVIAAGSAISDVPPPAKLPKPSSPYSKGPTIALAAYTNVQSADQRSWQQGETYDTRDYCAAIIDVAADPGMSATIAITGYDEIGFSKYAVFPIESFAFQGKGASNSDGVIVESHRVTLMHPETSFAVMLSKESAQASEGELHVYLTPLACGYNGPERTRGARATVM